MSLSKNDQKMLFLQQKAELAEKLKKYCTGHGHRVPQTRREFLASGLMSVSATLAAPTMLQLVSQSAWADELVCENDQQGLPAFVNIQLVGGSALFANHLARGPGGDDRFQYGKLGVGPAPGVETLFSNEAPFWSNNGDGRESQIFKEVKARLGTANRDILQKACFVAVAAECLDDSYDNPHDITGFLSAAGLTGSVLPYLSVKSVRRSQGVCGGEGKLLFKRSLYSVPNHLEVASAKALEATLGFKGSLGGFSGDKLKNLKIQQQLVQLVEDLSKQQVGELLRSPNSSKSQQTFSKLVQCAVTKNKDVLTKETSVDIYSGQFPELAEIWKLDQGNAFNSCTQMGGLAISNALRGLSGAASIALGEYDYHFGAGVRATRSLADTKDGQTGTMIARTLLTAKLLNRPVFLYISADGSVSSPNDAGAGSDVNWQADYFKRSMNYIIAYDPSRQVEAKGYSNGSYEDAPYQLNHFVQSGGDYVVGNNNPIANKDSQALCAAAVFLNYLAFAGRLDLLEGKELDQTKTLLQGSLPKGVSNLYDYYLRIVGS